MPRIGEVDALRGFALLGIMLVHCMEYFELYWRHPEESHVRHAVDFLFADKAYAVFALLFGFSFFIIMDRQAQRGVDFSGRFVWRLVLLVGIGYLYSLVYVSDILQVLGVLVPCGQMSLSIYVAQGLVCVPLFYGYGLGWYGGIGQARALRHIP